MADPTEEDIEDLTSPEDIEEIDWASLEHDHYGPTWQKGEDGKYILPERTLGWDVIGWAEEYLAHPSIPDHHWEFTKEQARFVLWWYALDVNGGWIYRRGVLQRMKGWGKDPLLAVISLVELLGPCRFGGWDADGEPIAVDEPNAWVQISAVAKDQTQNTMKMFPRLITEKLKATYDLEVLKEHINTKDGRKGLAAITSNPRTLEGGRSTFVLMNETHHWVSGNSGIEMYETIAGNTTKSPNGAARFLAITNAYLPGEDSVAERMRTAYEDVLEGRAINLGWLYDSIEAHPKANLTIECLEQVVPKIRGDATWLSVSAIIADIVGNTSIGPARQRRMWLNQIVADQDALYDVRAQWDPMATDKALRRGDRIVLGFDGGRSDDSTALVAIRVSDGFVQLLHLQEKPRQLGKDDKWIVDYGRVDSAVHGAFRDYEVMGFFADVKMWESYVADWGAKYGEALEVKATGTSNPIAWDMRGAMRRVTYAHEDLMDAIFKQKLCHGGYDADSPWRERNMQLRRHIQNARRRENAVGVSFGKESRESPKKVDAYAALLLAHAAYKEYRLKHVDKKPKTGNRWFI